MSNLKIGIVAWKDENFFGVSLPYLQFIDYLGGDPHIIMPVKELPKNIDAIIIPGGPDISPSRYNFIPDYTTGKQCPFREYFDKYLLPQAIEQTIPILGICRGFQSLNVHFGGKIRQDMYHETNGMYERSKRVHEIDFKYNAYQIGWPTGNKKTKYKVNSLHHQGIYHNPASKNSDLAEDLIPLAVHKNYVEAFMHKELPIVGVQYHPEEYNDEFATHLFEYILETQKVKKEVEA